MDHRIIIADANKKGYRPAIVKRSLSRAVPTVSLLIYAGAASLFLIATRFLSIFPVLYYMNSGLRASLIPSINLSQMSEFSLVIAALGLGLKHISDGVVGILTFVFAITSMLSTYLIQYNNEIHLRLAPILKRLGLTDINGQTSSAEEPELPKEIVFLGFFTVTGRILSSSRQYTPQNLWPVSYPNP